MCIYWLLINGIPVDRSDKLRWMCALTPNRRTRFMSTSAHQPGETEYEINTESFPQYADVEILM